MKRFLIIAAFFPLLAFGTTEQEFYEGLTNCIFLVNHVDYEVDQINANIQRMDYDMQSMYSRLVITTQNEQFIADMLMDTFATASGRLTGNVNNLHDSTRAVNLALASLYFPEGVDLSPVISAISNNWETIESAIQNHTQSVLSSLSSLQSIIDALADILDAINNLGPGYGGFPDDIATETTLSTVSAALQDLLTDFSAWKTSTQDLFSWLSAANGSFQQFFTLANERLQTPDATLQTDLQRIWQYSLANITNILYHPEEYSIAAQLQHLTVDGENLRLSNEGWIAAENLAINTRQYFCSVEMLNQLKGLNSTNNLAWITNYLDTVQKPMFELFNFMRSTSIERANPWTSSAFNSTTNYFTIALDPYLNINSKGRAYQTYMNSAGGSNYFHRIEHLLMGLNGFFTPNTIDGEVLDENMEGETIERRMDYATNGLSSAVSELATTTNSLGQVVTSFTSLLSSLDIDEGSTTGYFTIVPEFEIGGFEFHHIYLQWSDLNTIVIPVRNCFTFLWYLLFAVLAFFLFRSMSAAFIKFVKFLFESLSRFMS